MADDCVEWRMFLEFGGCLRIMADVSGIWRMPTRNGGCFKNLADVRAERPMFLEFGG